jgi:hypothetical protein
MAKYCKKASEKVEKAMHKRKEGMLKSGRSAHSPLLWKSCQPGFEL